MSRVHAFFAMSVDGFIAGPNDEIDWLDVADGTEDTFTPFIKGIGALLMGRRSYDIASSFDGPWPYGELPILVATHRALTPHVSTVSACSGAIEELIAQARAVAAGKDVYVDGGQLIRQALDAGLVDEITATVIPVILGKGIAAFHDLQHRAALALQSHRAIGNGLIQVVYRPCDPPATGNAE